MAKLTLTDVAAGYLSVDAVNANNAAIEAALENTLSRDGTSPNTMTADLDMNGFSILNQISATGATNFVYIGDWATSTAYSVNNLVTVTVAQDATNGGASYICLVAHTSGTFSTDLASAYWRKFSARGATGASGGGSGDLVSTNNLSDIISASTARTNLDVFEDVFTTRGDILTAGASGAEQRLALGTSGYVLKSDGTDAVWADPTIAQDDWQYVTKQTASGSTSIDFTDLATGYDHEFRCRNILPATDGGALLIRTSADTGGSPTFDTASNYAWYVYYAASNSASMANSAGDPTTFMYTHLGAVGNVASGETGVNGIFTVWDPTSTTHWCKLTGREIIFLDTSSIRYHNTFHGEHKATAAVNAIRFYYDNGNITSGVIEHYKRTIQ